jgi:flagellar hook-length control protein FliK
MQNTPLPIISSTPPSNGMGAMNAPKSTTTDNAAATNSFQKVLSNQVQQRQQKNDNQQGKTTTVKSPQGEQKAADAKAAEAKADAKKDAADSSANIAPELADQFKDLALLAKQGKELKGKPEKSDETKQATDAAPVLTTDPAIAALAVPANVPVAPTDKPALTTEDAAAQKPQVETADSRPRGRLDQELGNMLAQSRTDSTDASQLAQAGDDKADMSAWLEKMLPGFNNGESTKLTEQQTAKVDNSATITQAQAVAATTPMNPVQASEAVGSSNTITAYPGRAGWDQAIGQKVAWMVAGGEQSATLTLNPPDMGPLQVVIHVHNDIADATFMSNNQEVRQALQDGMSNLRDMLNASGIQLGQSNVGEHTQSQQQLAESGGRSGRASGTATEEGGSAAAAVQTTVVRSGNGMVDTFV